MAPPPITKEQKEAKKADSQLEGVVLSRTEAPPVETETMKPLRAELETAINLLEGTVAPDPLDDVYLLLSIGKPPIMSKEFINFEKGSEVIPLPPKTEDLRDHLENYAKERQELIDKQLAGEETKEIPSFIQIEINEAQNLVTITNTLYLPDNIYKNAKNLVANLKKIIASGNEDRMLTALCCWDELKKSMGDQLAYKAVAENAFSGGKTEFAEITIELSNTQGRIAEEMLDRIETIAAGQPVSTASIFATTPLKINLQKLQKKAADMQMEELTKVFTGTDAMERIERGIKLGLYSNIEIAMYTYTAGELKAAMTRVEGFRKKGDLEKRMIFEGTDALAGWQMDALGHALSLVANLECIAWKTDLKDRVAALKGKVGVQPQVMGIGRLIASQHIPLNQLTARSRKDMEKLGTRAKEHLLYITSFIKNADDLTQEEKDGFVSRLDALSKEVTQMRLPGEFSTLSKKLTSITAGAEKIISKKHDKRVAWDEAESWNVRAVAGIKVYALDHGLEIIGGSAALGGIIGGASTRTPMGAWAGVKMGASAGSLLIAAAGTFVTADAMVRYFSGSGDVEQALADMRLGATYMLFAIGGGPIAAISAPVKAIAGGGAALANTLLLVEDIQRGDYLQIPADVAFIAIGSVAFLRVAGGAFRAIPLANRLKSTLVVANSTGVARVALKAKDKLVSMQSRALEAGYSPTMIGMNMAFGGFSKWYEISNALENGNYSLALTHLNQGFAGMTRAMVGFDFAIAGVAGAAKMAAPYVAKGAGYGAKATAGAVRAAAPYVAAPVVSGARATATAAGATARYFRLQVPAAQAKVVNILQYMGLYERVSAIAFEGGVKTFSVNANTALLDLVFATGGKVSAQYVKATLNLKNLTVARKIATLIRRNWALATTVAAKGKRAGPALKQVGRMMQQASKTRAAKLAAHGAKGAAILGVVAYVEYGHAEERKLGDELARLTKEAERQFVQFMSMSAHPAFGTPQFDGKKLIEAMALINEISEQVDDGVHPLSLQLEMGGDTVRRKRFLVSGAISLLMKGREVTDESLSSLASEMDSLFTRVGFEPGVHTRLGTLSLLGAIVLKEGPDGFADAYSQMYRNVPKDELYAYMDYMVSSYYCASLLGRDVDWASEVSFSAFRAFVDEGIEGYFQGWALVKTLYALEEGVVHPPEKIIDIAHRARLEVLHGVSPSKE